MYVAGGQTSGTNGTNTAVGFEIVVNYVDGTPSTTYKQSMFSLLEMYSLVDMSGKEIESFDIRLKATLSTSGVVTGWQIVGSQQTEIYKIPETAPKTSSTYNFDVSGTTWAQGAEKELSFVSLHWSQVEVALEQFGEGEWSIQINGDVSVTAEFEDGSEDSADANATVAMPFKYVNSGISQFSLSINNGVTAMSLVGQFESVGIPSWALLVLLIIGALMCSVLACYCYKKDE